MSGPASTRAIVIGGSIAGMSAAAAVHDFFDEVVVIDRDELTDRPVMRRGVPQSSFVHSLLERGRRELETLFPGFTDALLAAGVPLLDFGTDVAALRATGWITPAALDLKTLWPSRPLLEATVRRICLQRYKLRVIERASVVGLEIESAMVPRASGVRLRGPGGEVGSLSADLIIDASGRGSRARDWMMERGIAPPGEERVDAQAGYSARLYRAPDPETLPRDWWWKGIVIECAPPSVRTGGVLFPIEDGRWLVTLMGFNRSYPPETEAEFEEFARRLRSPLLAEAMARAEPLGGVIATRSFVNRFRRYDRWRSRLRRFVAIGDAACSFNPIYGQGMSTAAASAALLARELAVAGPAAEDLADRFHAAQGSFLAVPWQIATASDFLYPATQGTRPAKGWLRSLYLNALFESAWQDPVLHRHVVKVFHLIAAPETLTQPWVIARMLRQTMLRAGRRLTARVFEQPPSPSPISRRRLSPNSPARMICKGEVRLTTSETERLGKNL